MKNSEYWPKTSETVNEEDTRGGKQISQVREMGVVLDDASQTSVGVMLIAQLRDRGVSFSEIRKMDLARYKEIVFENFKEKKDKEGKEGKGVRAFRQTGS